MTIINEPDPRAAGFNYGVGWGSLPKPTVYHEVMDIARKLRKDSAEISLKSWEVDMLLREVRLAVTSVEKAKALRKLAEWLDKHRKKLK